MGLQYGRPVKGPSLRDSTMGTFAKRLGFAGTAHARLTDVVVSDLDPARKPAVVEVAEIATGLPLEQATRIVDTHEPIECEDYIEAKVLREDLEAAGGDRRATGIGGGTRRTHRRGSRRRRP